jgi:hypothetical protein
MALRTLIYVRVIPCLLSSPNQLLGDGFSISLPLMENPPLFHDPFLAGQSLCFAGLSVSGWSAANK